MNMIKAPWWTSFRYIGILLLVVSAQGIQAQTAEERGKEAIVTYMCYGCHGFTGDGGQTDVAPRINVDRLSIEAMMAYVRNPGGRMPPYHTEEQIPDQALRDIYAYLKSLPPSPDWKDIPLLKD